MFDLLLKGWFILMLMKKEALCKNAKETFAAMSPDYSISIVELADEDLANVVAGAGYAADMYDEEDADLGGAPPGMAGQMPSGYGQMPSGYGQMPSGYGQVIHRRLRRRAAIRRRLRRYRPSSMTPTSP